MQKPRLTFCGEPCVHEWKIRSSAEYARAALFARDRGVCAQCSANTIEGLHPVLFEPGKTLNYGFRSHPSGLWEADHILPVAEGGGSAGLENLQTLCTKCHKRKTADQAARAALTRRRAKEGAHGGSDGTQT